MTFSTIAAVGGGWLALASPNDELSDVRVGQFDVQRLQGTWTVEGPGVLWYEGDGVVHLLVQPGGPRHPAVREIRIHPDNPIDILLGLPNYMTGQFRTKEVRTPNYYWDLILTLPDGQEYRFWSGDPATRDSGMAEIAVLGFSGSVWLIPGADEAGLLTDVFTPEPDTLRLYAAEDELERAKMAAAAPDRDCNAGGIGSNECSIGDIRVVCRPGTYACCKRNQGGSSVEARCRDNPRGGSPQ